MAKKRNSDTVVPGMIGPGLMHPSLLWTSTGSITGGPVHKIIKRKIVTRHVENPVRDIAGEWATRAHTQPKKANRSRSISEMI